MRYHGMTTAILVVCVLVGCTDSESAGGSGGGSTTGLSIKTQAIPTAIVGAAYQSAVSASGGSGSGFVWSVIGGSLPSGISLQQGTPDAILTGTPTQVRTLAFTLQVTDSAGGSASRAFQLQVNPAPLSINTTLVPNATVQVLYQASISTSGGVAPFNWSISMGSLPPGLTFQSGTPDATISGTPTQAGTFPFTLQVTDSATGTASQTFQLQVNASPISISTTTLPNATEQASYQATISASGGVAPFSWIISTGALPPGLTLQQGTPAALISGTPGQAGSFSFTLLVTDSSANTDSQGFLLQVNPPSPSPLVITTTSLPSAAEQSLYQQSVFASGGTPPFSWSISTGALPPGLTLLPGMPDATISGTPTVTGTFNFVIQVHDATSAVATAVLAVVVAPQAFSFAVPHTLPYGVPYFPYFQHLTLSGGVAPYSGFQVVSGTLPPGILLKGGAGWPNWQVVDANCLSGNPSQAGVFSFTLQAMDATSAIATRAFSLTVHPAQAALIIGTQELGPWWPGLSTSEEVICTGGVYPYSWSIAAGSGLPPGMVLTQGSVSQGVLSGQPTVAGIYTFTVVVTDSAQASATRSFTVEVGSNSRGFGTYYGEPVTDATVFVVETSEFMSGSRIASVRMELAALIQELPPSHTFDVISEGSKFGLANSYNKKLWGSLQPATTANKAAAIAFVYGPDFTPGLGNAPYPALQNTCQTYPAHLRQMFFVNTSAPYVGGTWSQLITDMPIWWAGFTNCAFTAVAITGTQSTAMFQLATALGGTYVAT